MRYKKLVHIIVFFTVCSCAQTHPNAEKEAIKEIRLFYNEYITEASKWPMNKNEIDKIVKKYCSIKLIKKNKKEEFDYDPFLNAQDVDIQWLKTLKIKRNIHRINSYRVLIYDESSEKEIVIDIGLIFINSHFKINEIHNNQKEK